MNRTRTSGQQGPAPGLVYELFGDPDLTQLLEQGTSSDLDSMVAGLDCRGIRVTGSLVAPCSGEYRFRVAPDTGMRLRIAHQLVIDNWSKTGVREGTVHLTEGYPTAFVLEWFFDHQSDERPVLQLWWMPPGGREEPVPASAYLPSSQRLRLPVLSPALVVSGCEQSLVDMRLPDGGLKPAVGVHNVQVFRATRGRPDLADGDGFTYAHQHDLGVWKGRLYAVWGMTPRDEDLPPYKVVYATSADGFHWSAPGELFPRGVGWPQRFYFYLATNGRMLALAGSHEAKEWWRSVCLVREIGPQHQLGTVHTLIDADPSITNLPPSFEMAADAGFVAACREAVEDNLLLEQQDLGCLLGDRRMKWHLDPPQVDDFPFGKALCFFQRRDGVLVGLCKMGFVTLSADGGKTWSEPVVPPTLVANSGKVWGQRTSDGRYAISYNPDRRQRFPLVLAHSDDGREFDGMRFIHGELPRQRYEGGWKNLGPQYVRGLAEWADDGTFADRHAIWLIYSVNKEDIWVSRVPLPVKTDETVYPSDDFRDFRPGVAVPGWNLYSPRWAPAAVVEADGHRFLELRDGDPYDYARAVRVFPESATVGVELCMTPLQTDSRLEIELLDARGRCPVRVALTENGLMQVSDGHVQRVVGEYIAGEELFLAIAADLTDDSYTVRVNNEPASRLAVAEAGCKALHRLSLRTGAWRGLEDGGAVEPTTDVPETQTASFRVFRVAFERSV